ncbi:MAG: DUF934 domain-containing protein [Burkholderiales bacterium]|nr:DUF934 domain-containing protein [Burkholderiales bacterium]
MKFIDTLHARMWKTVGGEDGPAPHPLPREGQLLTLEQWHAVRDTWPIGLRTGVTLANTVDVQDLQADLPRLALVVLQFPKWTDGRAYTQARLLRQRLRYTGEVRATGDVVVDMLPLLHRCGFDAVVLRQGQSLDDAQQALRFFDSHYQADAVQTQSRFARGAA